MIKKKEGTKKNMAFLEANGVPLRVIMNSGVSTETGVKVNETQMFKGGGWSAPTYRVNKGNYGVTFSVDIIVKETDIYNGLTLKTILDNWEIHSDVINVITDAIDIPNSKYILTIGKKKQTTHYNSIWELTFHEYLADGMYFSWVRTKGGSMSPIDYILFNAPLPIWYGSPTRVIQALILKLQQKGYGIIDSALYRKYAPEYLYTDILNNQDFLEGYYFYHDNSGDLYEKIVYTVALFNSMNGVSDRTGRATRETIELLLQDTAELNRNLIQTYTK